MFPYQSGGNLSLMTSDLQNQESSEWVELDEPFETEEPQEDADSQGVNANDFAGLLLAPSDWTVGTIKDQIGKQIDLDPEFQRRNVWNIKAKSRFIESIILGVPIPQILLSSKVGSRSAFLVLDGKQRLTTIIEFVTGKTFNNVKFKLRDLTVLTELEGKYWKDLEADTEWSDRFLNATLRTAVLRGWSNESVLYEIFHRLNSGSVRLSPMELRMSLHPGEFLKFIIKWTEEIGPLHTLLRKKFPDARMNDVELCVRFLAFTDGEIQYSGNLKEFLDKTSITYNEKFDDPDFCISVKDRLDAMNESIKFGIDLFGLKNFCRKWLGAQYEYRFNRAIFDVMIGSLIDPRVRQWSNDNPGAFETAYKDLCNSSRQFVRYVESTTKTVEATEGRFKLWYDKLFEVSGIRLAIPNIG